MLACLPICLGSCQKTGPALSTANNQKPGAIQGTSSATPTLLTEGSPTPSPLTESAKRKVDACTLLTSKEIKSVQGEVLKETKASGSSGGSAGDFRISQCVFTLPTFANSVSLTVTEKGDGPRARDPKEFWKETFHRERSSKAEGERDRETGRGEEQENSKAPRKISGIGDDAFWTGSRVGGALYVLKGSAYIRLSVGGAGDEEVKIRKSTALAQMIIRRL